MFPYSGKEIMRLWSLHPRYLDPAGLVAVWREGLLARKVLSGRTRGYKNHPQLERFKSLARPLDGIDCYLRGVYEESLRRGYKFDGGKIRLTADCPGIPVTDAQLQYELSHLRIKLFRRNPGQFERLRDVKRIRPHPLFRTVPGEMEPWEKTPAPARTMDSSRHKP
jgi:hypothetical protein